MIYAIDSGSVTLAAAHTTKGAIGTIKLANGFWNPTTSNVNAVIQRVTCSIVSGTLAGPLFWNYLPAALPSNTVTGPITQTFLTGATGLGGATNSFMSGEVNVVITQAVGTPSMIQLGLIGGPAAIATGVGTASFEVVYPQTQGDNFMLIPPGTLFGITSLGAAGVIQTTIYWIEVPV